MKTNKVVIIAALGLFALFSLSQSVLAQEDIKSLPKYGKDSVTTVTKLSLFNGNYDLWEKSGYKEDGHLKDALKDWRWLFDNAPKATENLYIRGVKMYRYMIGKASDSDKKTALVDTLMKVYDNRLAYFPTDKHDRSKEGDILGYKGIDLYQYQPDRVDEVFDILKKSTDINQNKTKSFVLVYYFRTAIQKVKNGVADKSLIVETYDQISSIIDYNLEKYKDRERILARWQSTQGNIENSFEPYATCEDLTGIYQQKFDENPQDKALLEKITSILDKKGCNDTELYFIATKNLHNISPNAESADRMGTMLLKRENYDEAIKYLKEAAELYEDDLDKADIFKTLTQVYSVKQNYSTARNYAYKALEIIPKDGSLYIMIGDMYAASAKNCGSNDLTSKVAYWVAVDKYEKAKSIDPTVVDNANVRIAKYKQYFPSKETIFFYDLNEGDSYEVKCWINETTTVRASN